MQYVSVKKGDESIADSILFHMVIIEGYFVIAQSSHLYCLYFTTYPPCKRFIYFKLHIFIVLLNIVIIIKFLLIYLYKGRFFTSGSYLMSP